MLTGHEIMRQIKKGNITIDPFNVEQLNPNSYNLKLAPRLKVYEPGAILDPKQSNTCYNEIIIPSNGFVLSPGKLYIGATKERIASDKYISAIDGRSSIGRLGMQIHLTAGFGDLGFNGTYTLEITVVNPVRIYSDLEIAQVYFEKPTGKIDFLYHGRYQGQIEPTESRINIDSKTIKGYHGKYNKEEPTSYHPYIYEE
jgi:dCTP deaminase